MGQPAARITDMHTCPMFNGPVPHVGGPISAGAPTVLIGGLPAARVGDMAVCVGPPDVIVKGSATVLIAGMPAARMGDSTAHGGVIVLGCPTVLIGDAAGASNATNPGSILSFALAGIALAAIAIYVGSLLSENNVDNPDIKSLDAIAKGVNPDNGTINCGNIIDAVIARLNGSNPNAVAPVGQDGSWDDIEKRHNTTLDWGESFDDAYKAVEDKGNGATAIIGIGYSNNVTSHVVVITNRNGAVAIIEGQGGGQLVTSPEQANKLYNSDAGSTIGFGLLP